MRAFFKENKKRLQKDLISKNQKEVEPEKREESEIRPDLISSYDGISEYYFPILG